jgi:hypothetical protein
MDFQAGRGPGSRAKFSMLEVKASGQAGRHCRNDRVARTPTHRKLRVSVGGMERGVGYKKQNALLAHPSWFRLISLEGMVWQTAPRQQMSFCRLFKIT